MKARNWFLALLLIHCNYLHSQTDTVSKLGSVNILAGIKIYNAVGHQVVVSPGQKLKGFLSYVGAIPVVGIEYKLPAHRFGLEYRRHTWVKLITKYPDYSIARKTTSDILSVNYYIKRKSRKDIVLGAGHTWVSKMDAGHVTFNANTNYKGLTFYAGLPFKWLYVELRNEMLYSPHGLYVIDRDLWGLNFIYKIPAHKREDKLIVQAGEKKFPSDLNFIAGITGNKNPFKERNANMRAVSLAPHFGLELYFPKARMALDLRRTHWVNILAGNASYAVNGYAQYSFIGLTGYTPIKGYNLKVGLSHCWAQEGEYDLLLKPNVVGPIYYKSRGISPMVSFPVYRQFDIEVRGMYFYQNFAHGIPYGFNSSRLLLSGIYRFNPAK